MVKAVVRSLLVVLLALSLPVQAVSGEENAGVTPFQFSLMPGVGVNGWRTWERTNVVSVNLLGDVSSGQRAFTISGLWSVVKGDAQWVHVAGVAGYAGSGRGLMLSGAVNVVRRSYDGLMVAGAANIVHGDVRGVQLAALANSANRVRGLQIGLVNIAVESDIPLGLLNIIRNGEMTLGVDYDMTGNLMLAFRSGGRYTYGILGVGYNHYLRYAPVAFGVGLGAHAPVCRWFGIDNEFRYTVPLVVAGRHMEERVMSRYMNVSYSLLPAFRIGSRLRIYGGVSLNYMLSDSRRPLPSLVSGGTVWQRESDGGFLGLTRETLYFGFSAGVSVRL